MPEAVPGAVALVPQRERAARMAGPGLPPSTGRSVTQGSPFRLGIIYLTEIVNPLYNQWLGRGLRK